MGHTTQMQRPASEYFARNIWISADPEERTLPYMIELLGDEKFFIGSDYPHAEGFVRPIEKALGVSMNQYQVGERTAFSNDGDPSLPAPLAAVVQAVLGLNDIEVAHSSLRHSDELAHPDYSPGPAYVVRSSAGSTGGSRGRERRAPDGRPSFSG